MSSNEAGFDHMILEGYSFAQKCAALLSNAGIHVRHEWDNQWSVYQAIRKAYSERPFEVTLIESEWLDFRRANDDRRFQRPLPDLSAEFTYFGAVDVSVYVDDLSVSITMWDGDIHTGAPTNRRCKWRVKLSDALAEVILSSGVDKRLLKALDRADRLEQARIKAERMRAIFVGSFMANEQGITS